MQCVTHFPCTIETLTYDLEVVCIADRGLDVRIVLRSGHALQVALMKCSNYDGEGCNLPIRRTVEPQQLVPVSLPGNTKLRIYTFTSEILVWFLIM